MDDCQLALSDLIAAAEEIGYPKEFGLALAQYLGGPKTMERMAAYLRQCRPQSFEEAADEAITLVSERSRWIEEERSEEAQAAYTAFVNRPREADEAVDWTDDSWTEVDFYGDGLGEESHEETDGTESGPYNYDFDEDIPW